MPKRSVMMASAAVLAVAAVQASGAVTPPDSAVVSTKFADCTRQESGRFAGQYVARYAARVQLRYVGASNRPGDFYLQKDIRIDHEIGTNRWRKLEAASSETPKFANGPYYTSPGVRTVVGPTIVATQRLRGKLTLKLKKSRRGPDKTVWKAVFTVPITCTDPSVPIPTQPPPGRGPVG